MKKTMKKRAFISAIAMLIVSAIVLTSSTFAWFSMAKQVEVETMQLNITSPEGIQISANTNAFTTKLTMDDFTAASTTRFKADDDHTNVFPEVLSPTSCAFRLTAGGYPRFFSGSISDKNKITCTEKSDIDGGYVVFDVFVKLGAAQKVFWGDSTITCADNEEVPTAMRIAMVNCGASLDKTVAKTIKSGIQQNGANQTAVLYEVDATHHTAASMEADGVVDTKAVYSAAADQTPTGNNNNIITTNTSTPACTKVNETDKTQAYFNGAAGINRIRVYVWMEGQDVDCANDVAGSTVDVSIKFSIA